MSEPGPGPSEPLASLRRIVDSLLAIAGGRAQLFGLELQSEKLRLLDALLHLGIALVVAGVGLALGIATLAFFLWEAAGYPGLIVLTVLLRGIAALMLWRLRVRLRRAPMPFAGTVAEFQKDRACFTRRS